MKKRKRPALISLEVRKNGALTDVRRPKVAMGEKKNSNEIM